MQVTAILMPTTAVPPDQAGALPQGDGEWAALMASFLVDAQADPSSENVESQIEEIMTDAMAPEGITPEITLHPLLLTEELTPAKGAEVMAPAGLLAQISATLPMAAVGETVQDGPIVAMSMVAQPPDLISSATDPQAETPVVNTETPDGIAPKVSDALSVVAAAKSSPNGPPVRRTTVENLWEMQGLIPADYQKDETVSAVEQPKAAPEVPDMFPDATQLDASVPLVLTADMEIPDTLQLTPDLQVSSGSTHRVHMPLLHGQGAIPVLAPEFLNLVQSQASAPSDGGVSVTLAPVELGELHMAMVQDGDSLRVSVTADRPETLDLLRRNSDQLSQELRQAGFQSTSFSFAQSGQGNPRPDAKAAERAWEGGSETTSPDPLGSQSPTRRLTTTAGLDLRM